MIRIQYSITDLLAVMEFSGKNDVRYYLNGVHLTVGADFNSGRMAGVIEATNGHHMVSTALDAEDIFVGESEESRLRDVILDIDCLKRHVRKPRAKDRDDCEILLTRDTSGVDVVHYVDSNDPSIMYPIQIVEGKFPETRRVWNVAFNEKLDTNVSVQGDYLSVVAKACKLFRDRTDYHANLAPMIQSKTSGHTLVQVEGRSDVVMIVMSCRVNWDNVHKTMPYWLERDLMDETDHSDTGT